jgi:hypothetical protein
MTTNKQNEAEGTGAVCEPTSIFVEALQCLQSYSNSTAVSDVSKSTTRNLLTTEN